MQWVLWEVVWKLWWQLSQILGYRSVDMMRASKIWFRSKYESNHLFFTLLFQRIFFFFLSPQFNLSNMSKCCSFGNACIYFLSSKRWLVVACCSGPVTFDNSFVFICVGNAPFVSIHKVAFDWSKSYIFFFSNHYQDYYFCYYHCYFFPLNPIISVLFRFILVLYMKATCLFCPVILLRIQNSSKLDN